MGQNGFYLIHVNSFPRIVGISTTPAINDNRGNISEPIKLLQPSILIAVFREFIILSRRSIIFDNLSISFSVKLAMFL